jgi:hypothetical protein
MTRNSSHKYAGVAVSTGSFLAEGRRCGFVSGPDSVDMDEDLWHGLHDLLGRKWTAYVLLTLRESPRGFNELKRSLPGLTSKVLST